ncbi:MAG: nucleotidyltransferase [Candidatus Omnitrophica bacterium]|nr:nucleotidyltransferase [Candidatus Omnitrophota bacterium]
MEYKNALSLVAAEFKNAAIPCVLVGGFAVNYYKASRSTKDADFLIVSSDFEKAAAILECFQYKRGTRKEYFARMESNDLRLMDVDFLFVDPETIAQILKHGEKIKIAGGIITIPSLEHLISLKLHAIKANPKGRELIDLVDIIELIKRNNFDFHSSSFRELCLTYGTQDLYQKIFKFLE